jgi:hypothetical protein
MCNLNSITTSQAAIIALFRVNNRCVGNLALMPGVSPDYPAPATTPTPAPRWSRCAGACRPPTAHRPSARHQHPQHLIAALALVAQAREPLLGAGQQLRRVRAGDQPQEKDVVWFALNDDRPLFAFNTARKN